MVSDLTGDVIDAVVGDVSPSGIMYLTRGGSGAGASNVSVSTRTIYAIDLSRPTLTATALPVVPPPTLHHRLGSKLSRRQYLRALQHHFEQRYGRPDPV
jgi:hypothetical protein